MENKIEVVVKAEYMDEHSKGDEYVFTYHISIRNQGTKAAQLLSRKWLITDADGNITEVQGDGVIGEQPIIQPQGEHQYSSFSVLKTPVGCMQGSYLMQAENGDLFEAEIPTFTLAVKGVLH
ncbi:MAG: Co2+/Mg2+ efflux protein ApaG [Mariprofundaceae bacterium]|nr:Co2+/Mg2+ efflux protein ApaG [Mariprofundaceae bacterium]